jgi:hypothetical protein
MGQRISQVVVLQSQLSQRGVGMSLAEGIEAEPDGLAHVLPRLAATALIAARNRLLEEGAARTWVREAVRVNQLHAGEVRR